MTLGGIHFSKNTDDWSTPPDFYKKLDDEFHFDFDPCPIKPSFDGLKVPWRGCIYVNPPYSDVKRWLIKAHEELRIGNAHTVVFLVFARTDTAWFHDYVLAKGGEVRYVRGRLKFGNNRNSAPSPSIVVVLRSHI